MASFSYMLCAPQAVSYLSNYSSPSSGVRYYSTTFQGAIIRTIEYDGENAIILKKSFTPYRYENIDVGIPMYQYYLLGKNVSITSVTEKVVRASSIPSWTTNGERFQPDAGATSDGYQQSLAFVLFDTNWYADTSDYVSTSLPTNLSTCISMPVPMDNLSEIPESYSVNSHSCVLGIPDRFLMSSSPDFSTRITGEPNIFAQNFQYGTNANYTLYQIGGGTLSRNLYNYPIPFYRNRNINSILFDNYLCDSKGNFKYNFNITPDHTYITAYDAMKFLADEEYQYNLDNLPPTTGYVTGGSNPGYFNWYNMQQVIVNGAASAYNRAFPNDVSRLNYTPLQEAFFTGIYVTEDSNGASNYVQTGNLPDDAYINEVGDDGVPNKWKSDEGGDNEDGEDNSSTDDMELPSPTKGALTAGAARYFLFTKESMESFLQWFWYDNTQITDILNNWITNMYGNLKECILQYRFFPCSLSALGTMTETSDEIILGKFNTSVTARRLSALPSSVLLGTINIKTAYPHFNTFVDYEGYTNFQIYLPYFGITKLPTKSVQNKVLKVYYAVDVTSGEMTYIIKSYEPDSNDGFVVFETVVPIGEAIPLSLVDSLETATNLFGTAVNVAGSVIGLAASIGTGNVIGAAMSTKALTSSMDASETTMASIGVEQARHTGEMVNRGVSGATNIAESLQFKSDTPSSVGQITSLMAKWSPQKCYLLVDYPIVKRDQSQYGKHIGYLNYQPFKLSSLAGFTTCVKPQIDFKQTAPLLKEIEEIYQLMESGIIL